MLEMNNIRNILYNNNDRIRKITLKNGVKIVETDNNKYVFKKKSDKIKNTYNYLMSRAFDYFPKYYDNDEYDIYEYIEDVKEPEEQKIEDLIYIISLLHSKTTFYKEVDIDDYKYIYESVNLKIKKITKYYNELMYYINSEVYMAPSSYLLARNINIVFGSLEYCKYYIDKWYEMVKDKRKARYVRNHNNVSLEHYLKKDKPYLISWNKSKIDLPICDLIILYKNHYLDFDFGYMLKLYESKYPLFEEERLLLFINLMLPDMVDINKSEYQLCIAFRYLIDYLYKTNSLVTEYSVKDETDQSTKFN